MKSIHQYNFIGTIELEIDFLKLSSRRSEMSRLIINLSKDEINSFRPLKGVKGRAESNF